MKFSTTKAVIRYNLYLGTFKNDKKVLPKCKQKPEASMYLRFPHLGIQLNR